MARARLLSFLNLTRHLGDRYVLLDVTKQLLLPALFTQHVRSYCKTRYFFFRCLARRRWQCSGRLLGGQIILYGL
jgi:hypothetical protein